MKTEKKIYKRLKESGLTLSLAESCTGGMISARLVSQSGISRYFYGGVVSYVNEVKEKLLFVDHETLSRHTAVSAPVAEQMARGVIEQTGSDLGLSVTGLAGPLGGTPEIPVGRVFVGISQRGGDTYSVKLTLRGSRRAIRRAAAEAALRALLAHMEKIMTEEDKRK